MGFTSQSWCHWHARPHVIFISMSAFVEVVLGVLSYPFLTIVSFHPYLSLWYLLIALHVPFWVKLTWLLIYHEYPFIALLHLEFITCFFHSFYQLHQPRAFKPLILIGGWRYWPFWDTWNNHLQNIGQQEESRWKMSSMEMNGTLPLSRPPRPLFPESDNTWLGYMGWTPRWNKEKSITSKHHNINLVGSPNTRNKEKV